MCVAFTNCREFRKASSRIGQALKGETQGQAGRRDLAQLSPWFEHFTSPTGWAPHFAIILHDHRASVVHLTSAFQSLYILFSVLSSCNRH
jgi:hypothetical protein